MSRAAPMMPMAMVVLIKMMMMMMMVTMAMVMALMMILAMLLVFLDPYPDAPPINVPARPRSCPDDPDLDLDRDPDLSFIALLDARDRLRRDRETSLCSSALVEEWDQMNEEGVILILSVAALATSSFVVSGRMLVPQRIRRAQKIPERRRLMLLRLRAQIMLGGVGTRILFKLARLSIWLL
ncbi:hypothetical protein GB937_006904 [Aspergillus fischeri]|nr:hypothetical protein GB937_006904 [Aspergillus fischeri]